MLFPFKKYTIHVFIYISNSYRPIKLKKAKKIINFVYSCLSEPPDTAGPSPDIAQPDFWHVTVVLVNCAVPVDRTRGHAWAWNPIFKSC